MKIKIIRTEFYNSNANNEHYFETFSWEVNLPSHGLLNPSAVTLVTWTSGDTELENSGIAAAGQSHAADKPIRWFVNKAGLADLSVQKIRINVFKIFFFFFLPFCNPFRQEQLSLGQDDSSVNFVTTMCVATTYIWHWTSLPTSNKHNSFFSKLFVTPLIPITKHFRSCFTWSGTAA